MGLKVNGTKGLGGLINTSSKGVSICSASDAKVFMA